MKKLPSKKTIEKYRRLIKGKTWTKQEIYGFLKLLRSIDYINDTPTKQAILDLQGLWTSRAAYYGITSNHAQQGLNWINSKVLLKRGGLASKCGFDLHHESILRNFKQFKFVGIHIDWNYDYARMNDLSPIYKIES